MKKILVILASVLLISLITAQASKIEISTTKETFEQGEKIALKITLLDSQNNPIKDQVFIIIEDSEKTTKIEKNINSNEIIEIELDEKTSYGQGTITAKYGNLETVKPFFIKLNEKLDFEINEDLLTITNIGNIKYTKPLQIMISDTKGEGKTTNIEVGDKIKFRLIAPEGTYNIKVISEGKILFSQNSISLNSPVTGDAIGAISKNVPRTISGMTGLNAEEDSEGDLASLMEHNKFVYVFIAIIFCIGVLIAIEKRYRKKASK